MLTDNSLNYSSVNKYQDN